MIVRGTQFSEECRDGQATLLAFAHDSGQFNARCAGQDQLVVEHAFRATGLRQFDLDMAEGERVQFVPKPLLQFLGYGRLRDRRAARTAR